ncbi:MAG: DNA-directed RNA polymerase subunit beta' [Candidatus Nomurabacteria bacterium]|nr:MAG: DNA-directed RNA polymerase subunit beta' [Candidatus Nomurabacteria bacterium]
MIEEVKPADFKAIRLKLASPDAIHAWSYGEVTKPETINYRTQKPEKSGLFAEEIFGPSKDWECYCGKYKRIRYKGIVCDKCGVEVTRSLVRRERMGHIDLAAPCSHIWFLRGVPSKIGLILDLSVQELERVIYFANFIITDVNEELRKMTLEQLDQEAQAKKKAIESELHQQIQSVKQRRADADKNGKDTKAFDEELDGLQKMKEEQLQNLSEVVDIAKKELKDLQKYQIVSENVYHNLSLKYGQVFEAGIGAESIRQLLVEIDLKEMAKQLENELIDAPENKARRLVRRLKLVKNFLRNGLRPEWMILSAIPVIPPDLRPMVQLDGGRFATSDLNDLYRRVINRNNRLKRLIELNAPEVICRNEKRMLQEAVDALIDNGARHGKTVTASTGQKRMLKSIADTLKGKQGRFRQNLLGKRVDYSGRSVIVIGPHLKLYQCGLPKRMALELFRPFVISELIKREYVHNVRSASRFIEANRPEVWDILEEITKGAHVLLNRAPTLHRLGIQAFQPILIEGKAIQIHPLVCAAFNADFDGDQMAVHVPLTEQAKWEAKELMLSSKNLLKPATGSPVVSPSQDLVLGMYYLSLMDESDKNIAFSSPEEAKLAYDTGRVTLHQQVKIRLTPSTLTETTVGRVIFNEIVPKEMGFVNEVLDKKTLSKLVGGILSLLGNDRTVEFLDAVKRLSFETLTSSGLSWGMDDLPIPEAKQDVIKEAATKVDEIHSHYESGLLTEEERHAKIIEIWASVKSQLQAISRDRLDKSGPVYMMIESGARGSWEQITQMMGMKGLVTNPSGGIIELPVKGSFKEGFDVLEYFISTHGARKGLSDTALRTANAGYLTRRLIDVAQDIVIREEDCGDTAGFTYVAEEAEQMGESLQTFVHGRVLAADIVHPKTKKVLIAAGTLVTDEEYAKLEKVQLESVTIRSVLSCVSRRGICQKCYGYDLAYNRMVNMHVAVGIIAAQSIGEPGTQLTMRTFHTGGVAGQDITQGLPRVEELFEARPVRKPSILADQAGTARVEERDGQTIVTIRGIGTTPEAYKFPRKKAGLKVLVEDGSEVQEGDVLYEIDGDKTLSKSAGKCKVNKTAVTVITEGMSDKEYIIPAGYTLWVKDGDLVSVGDTLTEGSVNLGELYHLKGVSAVQKYVIKDIQYIYSSQGQKLNNKHIEVIVRQMFSRVYVTDRGETELLDGDIVEYTRLVEANDKAKKEKTKPATYEHLLLGITKASLTTESFLSAASFQETARVLIDAAVSGKMDTLRGLKENVIIGKLIPVGTGVTMPRVENAEAEADETEVDPAPEAEKEAEKA